MSAFWRSSATLAVMHKRARMLQAVRAFFAARDVLEIETPLLASAAVTDPHLDSMRVHSGEEARVLNTSPEYCMKRFVSEHRCAVYQVSKSFRAGEHGPLHNPEFTMLEWYRPGFSLEQLMTETGELIQAVAQALGQPPVAVRQLSYRELFMELCGLNPHRCGVEQLADFARQRGLDIPQGLAIRNSTGLKDVIARDAWLDWLMSTQVVAALPADQLTVIVDFPASQCALAQLADNAFGEKVARRFECYIGALELANAYHELTEYGEQRQRFELDNNKRHLLNKPSVSYDRYVLQALEHGLPDCAGVSVGLDRLLMALTGAPSIDRVISYDWNRV